MKKIVFILTLFTSSMLVAQREIKVDLLDALALKTLEVTYEHYLTEQSSVGLSALFNFEGETADFRYNEDRVFTPFFRHYFSYDATWNFFGELFFAYSKGDEEKIVNSINVVEEYSDGALGVAVGYKYISAGGFTVDIFGGLGRNLFNDVSPTVIPRAGVNVGFQF